MEKFFRENKKVIFIVLGVVLVCLLLLVLMMVVFSNNRPKTLASSQILATPAALSGDKAMATPAPIATPIPTRSPEWRVSKVLEPIQIGRFRYAVLEFTNVSTGETKTGQCQQPLWPTPEIGHIYILTNTYQDYWLFVPIEGIESTFQRFAPINP